MHHHWLNAMRRSVEVAYFGELKLKNIWRIHSVNPVAVLRSQPLIQVEAYPFDFWIFLSW